MALPDRAQRSSLVESAASATKRHDRDIVPIDDLRDERVDDFGIRSFYQHVAAVVQVGHERVNREAILGSPLPKRLQQRIPISEVLIVAEASRCEPRI